MIRHFLVIAVLACSSIVPNAVAGQITGAGSSAAAPLYAKWAQSFARQTGVSLDYQPVGSSAGIKRIKAGEVDFGASDVAVGSEEAAKEGLICFPTAISGVVPVVNLPRVKAGELQLTGELLANIFARKILMWNDPAIAAANPHLALPKMPVTVVARQDGSGTTYNFTDYLSKVSVAWRESRGRNFIINWPADVRLVKGSGAVSEAIKATPGAIAYIDYNYVVQDQLTYAKMSNRDGYVVGPSARSFSAALANSMWKSSARYEEMLTDKPGAESWPITMGTFVIVRRQASNIPAMTATLRFFTWAFMKGDQLADGLDFVRLPDSVQARVFKELNSVTNTKGQLLQWAKL